MHHARHPAFDDPFWPPRHGSHVVHDAMRRYVAACEEADREEVRQGRLVESLTERLHSLVKEQIAKAYQAEIAKADAERRALEVDLAAALEPHKARGSGGDYVQNLTVEGVRLEELVTKDTPAFVLRKAAQAPDFLAEVRLGERHQRYMALRDAAWQRQTALEKALKDVLATGSVAAVVAAWPAAQRAVDAFSRTPEVPAAELSAAQKALRDLHDGAPDAPAPAAG